MASDTLVAEQGSYALTGNDAGLAWGHALIAGQGSHTLAGQDAGLAWHHVLQAEAGGYVLTGRDASFVELDFGASLRGWKPSHNV
jgi:hypothetical protein